MSRKRKQYAPAYRHEAARLVIDTGRPIVVTDPDGEAAQVFARIAETIDVDLAPTRRYHPELKLLG